ncbi:MAG: hypothetical protein KatS3mg009_3287 [Acidimicrobiia bacterium]|nr:MAG: hypothetical protein KatS3mg009_3287 [Acidimicrobiia bacterium]
MRGLELAQLPHERVVLRVADLRRVVHVVALVVVGDLLAQLGHPVDDLGGRGFGRHRGDATDGSAAGPGP